MLKSTQIATEGSKHTKESGIASEAAVERHVAFLHVCILFRHIHPAIFFLNVYMGEFL